MKNPLLLLLVLLLNSSFLWAQTTIPTHADSTDILKEVLNMHKEMPAPKKEFRKGHVNPREIKDYYQKTDNGFTIELPHKGLTPSPTIYQGAIYLSGGFGSKQFYAFDIQSGQKIWGVDLDDDGPSSAVIEDDIVVFNTESCTIFALEAKTGKQIWSYWLGDPLMSTPTISNGMVFTAYPASSAFNSGGGWGNFYQQEQKQEQLNEMPYPSTPEKENTYQGKLNPTHVLIAFDLKTGNILWQKWIDGDIMSAPVAEKDGLYVTTFPGTLYKFEAATGKVLSAHASRATSAPVIVDGEIYMSKRSDSDTSEVAESIAKINMHPGESAPVYQYQYTKKAIYLDQKVQKESDYFGEANDYDAGNGFGNGAPDNSGWQYASSNIGQSNVSSLQSFQGSRVLHHSGRNFSTMGDELVCTDPTSGEVIWTKPLKGDLTKSGGHLATPPLAVNGRLIIATLEGEVIVSKEKTGEEIMRFSTGEQIRYQPVVDQGKIYVTTMKGKMFCFETKDKKLTGWTTWGANAAHTNRVE